MACLLGAALAGCAADGRLNLKKLDFSKLKQPDWIKWDRDQKLAQAKPPAPVRTESANPAATSASTPPSVHPALPMATPARSQNQIVARGAPRPRPWRQASLNTASGQPHPRNHQMPPPEKNEQVAMAPQGKVTSETPKALAMIPPPVKPGHQKGSPAKRGYSSDDLVGLDGPSVERLLGKPDLSRKEPFAEVWQYTLGDCVLFLFIYNDEGDTAHVSHAKTGARDGDKNPEPGQCIGAILARHAQSPG
ncbi:MAG: hypothetical protein EXR08_08975 [Alphaproteobacteria bacterium]|nr:hypothetical protein [Alphaproteobacteria bacterium]